MTVTTVPLQHDTRNGSEHCVSVDSEHCVSVDSEHCVSVSTANTVWTAIIVSLWTVMIASVCGRERCVSCGQWVLRQRVDSELCISVDSEHCDNV